MNPPIRTPHTTCHQHTANTDAGYATERVDGQENHLFNILSNNTHFYTPTPKLNKHPSEMDFIGNHRKTTFVHLQISTQTHSQRSQTQHSASTQKPIAIRQPNLYIASQQTGGFSAITNKKKRRRKGNFSLQQNSIIHSDTLYIIPTNNHQYS